MFDRDEQEISQVIETGLESLLSGKATLDQILAQHPDQADAIRPELESAVWLVSKRELVKPRAGYVSASRKRVLAQIKQESGSQVVKHGLFGISWPKRVVFQWAMALVLVVVLLTGTGGVVSLAQSTLPGDGLYAVKRVSEQVVYSVAVSDIRRVELSQDFAERRLNEATALIAKGDYQAAEPVLREYERQVGQTVAMLQNVSDSQAQEKRGLAVSIKQDLALQAGRLADLQSSVPPSMMSSVLSAQATLKFGTAAADSVIIAIPATPTPTLLSSSTPTLAGTPSQPGTGTPPPGLVPTNGANPDSGGINPDMKPTDTPTPNHITKTPKPTNENRPPKKDDPDKKDNGKPPPKDNPTPKPKKK